MAHSHDQHLPGHSHGGGSASGGRPLAIALALAATYMVAEVVGGLMSGSLALLADAGHMLSDAASLALAWGAVWVGQRPATPQFSYGFRRSEVLAALINSAALIGVAGWVVIEAWGRWFEPPEINAPLMLAVALGGLVVNLIMLRVLGEGRAESLNVEGAWLHVLGDLLGSIGAVLSAGVIWGLGWRWTDPGVSVVIAALVAWSGLSLLRRTVAVLMEAVPQHIDPVALRASLLEHEDVVAVHDLHVWSITTGQHAMSAHIVTRGGTDYDVVIAALRALVREHFAIGHATFQLEASPCGPDHRCD